MDQKVMMLMMIAPQQLTHLMQIQKMRNQLPTVNQQRNFLQEYLLPELSRLLEQLDATSGNALSRLEQRTIYFSGAQSG